MQFVRRRIGDSLVTGFPQIPGAKVRKFLLGVLSRLFLTRSGAFGLYRKARRPVRDDPGIIWFIFSHIRFLGSEMKWVRIATAAILAGLQGSPTLRVWFQGLDGLVGIGFLSPGDAET